MSSDDMPGPYPGGRAQAESGTRIIENDYDAWKVRSGLLDGTLPADHPHVRQLANAWQAVQARGLTDDPGTSAIRYQILAHAARVLADVPAIASNQDAAASLDRLADHARKHAIRLRATGEQLFARSSRACAYPDRTVAEHGSRIVEQDYQRWACSPEAAQAARDMPMWERIKTLRHAWDKTSRQRLTDGPGPAAARYRELAEAAYQVSLVFTNTMPSASMTALLELDMHARKHAFRLALTARPAAGGAYGNLPERVATVTAHARTCDPHRPGPGDGTGAGRTRRQGQYHRDRRAGTERAGE